MRENPQKVPIRSLRGNTESFGGVFASVKIVIMAELGVGTAAVLHIIASTPNFILANQCMYDWFDDDYIKGGKMRFEDGCLLVPKGPGLGVELDREKMREYHEKYRKDGTFPVFGMPSDQLITAPPPLWPSY